MPNRPSAAQNRPGSGSIKAISQHLRKHRRGLTRTPKFCQRCCKLNKLLVSNEIFAEVILGSVRNLQRRARACKSCRQITNLVAESTDLYCAGNDLLAFRREIEGDGMGHYYISPPVFGSSAWVEYISIRPLEKLKREDIQGAIIGRSVDLLKLRTWLDFCDSFHGASCKPKISNSLQMLILIDVQRYCLITTTNAHLRFVALSYVWGSGQATIQTTKQNMHQLHLPASLDPEGSGPGRRLPNTIKDAIRLVRGLGIGYLWVDRLCIIQDDSAMKRIQIHAMGEIYANAYFTLAAAYGHDANAGLPGAGGGSKDRFITQKSLDFPDAQFILNELWEPSTWHTRGWTLQEEMLSYRLLEYTERGIEWKCERTTSTHFHEGIAIPANALETGLPSA